MNESPMLKAINKSGLRYKITKLIKVKRVLMTVPEINDAIKIPFVFTIEKSMINSKVWAIFLVSEKSSKKEYLKAEEIITNNKKAIKHLK